MEEVEISKPKIYSVSEINLNIRKSLETNYSNIWVEGEVSNYYFHNRRHMYFDIKDEHSKIKVVMFYENNKNLLFKLEDGLHVIINGYVSAYEKRGEYQLVALNAKPVGKGALILAFEQLKAKLEKKGYFDKIHKKTIPAIPQKIGVATSTGGAVLRDIISVLKNRFENFNLVVMNTNVQGPDSSDEICRAIDDLCEYGADVIIIARGGGSLEDLWAFNTEKLADKIFNCPVPVISAVGHETDFTISDFVADRRAATPSVAAEIVVINKAETVENLKKINKKLRDLTNNKIFLYKKELNYLISRKTFRKPETMLLNFWQDFEEARIKIGDSIRTIIENKKRRLEEYKQHISKKDILRSLSAHKITIRNVFLRMTPAFKNSLALRENKLKLMLKNLQERSPVYILGKGYAIVYETDKGGVIKNIDDIKIGQNITVRLKNGVLLSKIISKLYKGIGLENGNKN